MKKSLLFLFVVLIAHTAVAGNNALFQVDANTLSEKFENLNVLEEFIIQHEGVTLTDIKGHKPESLDIPIGLLSEEPPMKIPAYMWGLCCNFIGLLIILNTMEDKEQRMSAIYGCVTSNSLITIMYYLLLYTP